MPRELLEESLLFDLYYRENMKSRPYWAQSPPKFLKAAGKKGRQVHIEPFHYHFPQKGERNITSLPERLSREVYVLFEYGERDLLHQAKASELDIERFSGCIIGKADLY